MDASLPAPPELRARLEALHRRLARPGAAAPVVVMRGPAGTGKSMLAAALAPWLRGAVLSSDVLRKELLGMAPTARPGAEERRVIYGGPMHARTYAALLERGRAVVLAGRTALLDATYLRRDSRREAAAMAREVGAPFAIVDVTCEPEVVRARLRARAVRDDDASDADWQVYRAQVAEAEPLGEDEAGFLVSFRSGRPPVEALEPLLAVLERQLDQGR